jgi:CheY-like chemotaxis protein
MTMRLSGLGRALFQAEGFDVVGEAADGAGAVEAVVVLRPEIVLLDIHLPDLDGLAVAERLATIPNAPAVVLISSRDAATYGPAPRVTSARIHLQERAVWGGARRPGRLRETVRRLGLIGLVGVAVGLAAEWVGFGWGDPRHWIPDRPSAGALLAMGSSLQSGGRRAAAAS